MVNYKIYLSPPFQNGKERDALLNCLNSNWLAPVGPGLNEFEESLSSLHLSKPVLALNSGTAAIHLSLILAGVTTGDEVIVAAHTHNATVNPIIYQGAVPVFVDCDWQSWNISIEYLQQAIEDRIKKGKKPKAIIVVHLYGLPANMPAIIEMANAYKIPVIEDAAEALGSKLNDLPMGTWGDYGVLSFNGNKIITTSGGGALITKTLKQREQALFYATQARDEAPHFQHSAVGYNYRMSNLLASLGTAQLSDLSYRVDKRRANYEFYQQKFKELNQALGQEIVTSNLELPNQYSNRWLSTFLVHPYKNITQESWRIALESNQIESRPLWKPMHLQPIFSHFPFYGDHTSDRVFEQGICLPSGNELTNSQLDEITGIISSLYV